MLARVGPHLFIVVALLGSVLAFALCSGGSSKPATPADRAPTVALPSATAPATPEELESVAGVPVVHTRLDPGRDLLPNRVYYIETGCYACDVGPSTLIRVYLDADHGFHSDQLYPPTGSQLPANSYVTSLAASPNGWHLAAGVCSGTSCYGPGVDPSAVRTSVVQSNDGGITWAEVASWDGSGGVLGFSGATVFVARTLAASRDRIEYVSYPGEHRYGGASTTLSEDQVVAVGGTFVAGSGASWALMEGGPFIVPTLPDSLNLVSIHGASGRAIFTLRRTAQPADQLLLGVAGATPAELAHVLSIDPPVGFYALAQAVPVDEGHLAGTALVPRGNAVDPKAQAMPTLVDIDLYTGDVTPVIQPELLQMAGHGDRLQLLAVLASPFDKVSAQGDCLNVRTGASTSLPTLGCYNDGTLLSALQRQVQHGTESWMEVTTPDGKDGWANAAFLQLSSYGYSPVSPVAIHTGLPEIDAIVAALSTADMAQILPLVGFEKMQCFVTPPPGIGGPPTCPTGVADGTTLDVLPGAACEGYFTPRQQLRLDYFSNLKLFAVIRSHDQSVEPNWPSGDYQVVYLNGYGANGFVSVVYVENGKIVRTWGGCGQTPDQTLERAAPADILYRAP